MLNSLNLRNQLVFQVDVKQFILVRDLVAL